jgi:hypothetical protein
MIRRHFLTLAASLAGETLFSLPGQALPAQATTCGVSFDHATYKRYVELFNAADPGFTDYFSDKINFLNFLHGKAQVLAFYDKRQPYVKETIEVLFFCSDAGGAAAEVHGEFRCIQDCDDLKIFGRRMTAGEVQRAHGYLFYVLDDKGKIAAIKGPPPEVVQPWKIEKS